MSRRPAKFCQADIARAIRAAQQCSLPDSAVELCPDGIIRIRPVPVGKPLQPIENRREVVL